MNPDVIVVGGGLAGMSGAVRAAELGLKVVVLEKGVDARYPCNSRFSGGALHICMRDIQAHPEELLGAIERITDGTAEPSLARALVADAPRCYTWLKDQGVRFMRVPSIGQNHVLTPSRKNQPGLHWEGRGGDVALRTLESRLTQRGGRVIRATRVESLLMSARRCEGVKTVSADGITELRARAVLIADGGFQASVDYVREYISPRPELLYQRGAGNGTGDGIRMAQAAGAGLTGMRGGFYGHLLCRDVFVNPLLWPFPLLDFVASAGIVVDGTGSRFADEGNGGVFLANRVAKLDDPASSIVIFDDVTWNGAGRYRVIPPNPHLVLAGGTVHFAASLPELARELALPAGKLERTVAEYNAAIDNGQLNELNPPRSAGMYLPQAIAKAPFYAVRLCAGITYTMGGLRIDLHGRVLRPDDEPIDGLFAAGATTGGIDGGPRSGYVGGLMKATVFGVRSAETIEAAC